MKRSYFSSLRVLATVLAFTSLSAFAQQAYTTIVPASSAGSGSRAIVAIDQGTIYTTINNAQCTANVANNTANVAINTANTASSSGGRGSFATLPGAAVPVIIPSQQRQGMLGSGTLLATGSGVGTYVIGACDYGMGTNDLNTLTGGGYLANPGTIQCPAGSGYVILASMPTPAAETGSDATGSAGGDGSF